MLPDWYDVSHIAQWSTSVASREVTGCRHWVSACAVLLRQPPWSLLLAWVKITTHSKVLPSNYCTFLLVVCKKFVTWNGPSIQHIDATSLVKMCNLKSCSWQAQLNFHLVRFLNGQKLAKIQLIYEAPPKKVAHICTICFKAV